LQGNLNNFADQLSCQQACIAGTRTLNEAATAGGVSIPGKAELVFLTTATTAKNWVTLDATSVSPYPPPRARGLLAVLLTSHRHTHAVQGKSHSQFTRLTVWDKEGIRCLENPKPISP